MRIGLTYDLREDYRALGYADEDTAEFDSPETVSAIEASLAELGHRVERIGNVFALTTRLAAGERWDLVFNIAEGLHGFGREAQVPALLDAYRIPYTFSDPLTCAVTLHKGMAKHVVRGHGVPTPDFAVVSRMEETKSIRLPFPLFAKPVAEGTSKGIDGRSRIDSRRELGTVCEMLLGRYRQPVLVERYLPGREFTVGITGTGAAATAVAVLEVVLLPTAEAGAYSYLNKEHYEDRMDYRLVRGLPARRLAATALAAWRALGCRDGGRVDLRTDADGTAHFLEVNPLAGLHPQRSDLPIMCRLAGISYTDLIGRIVYAAGARLSADMLPLARVA